MSNDGSGNNGARLTLEDPVSRETLDRFRMIHETRLKLAESLLQLEQNRVQILGAVKRLNDEQARLFERVLVERGLTPDTPADIDAGTGQIKLRGPLPPSVEEGEEESELEAETAETVASA